MNTQDEWQEVSQALVDRPRTPEDGCRVTLSVRKGSAVSSLHFAFGRRLLATLGWARATRLGLQVGQGRFAGWLRLHPDPRGRLLRPAGSNVNTLAASMAAPDDLARFEAPSTVAETRVQGDVLLVRLPWEFEEEEDGDQEGAS